jgi:hypothetical protein
VQESVQGASDLALRRSMASSDKNPGRPVGGPRFSDRRDLVAGSVSPSRTSASTESGIPRPLAPPPVVTSEADRACRRGRRSQVATAPRQLGASCALAFETMALMSDVDLPVAHVRAQVASRYWRASRTRLSGVWVAAVLGRNRRPLRPCAAEPHPPGRQAPVPRPVTWSTACTASLRRRKRSVRPDSNCLRAGPLHTAQRACTCRPRPTFHGCARPPPLDHPCRGGSQTAPLDPDHGPGSWPPRRLRTGTGRRLPPRRRPSERPRSTPHGSHIQVVLGLRRRAPTSPLLRAPSTAWATSAKPCRS